MNVAPPSVVPDDVARNKIKSLNELGELAEKFRASGKTVALCHGVFDLVHLGHVRHLETAAAEADVLFVTITADRFVNKGPGRPIFTGPIRAEMLASLACVEYVGINDHPSAEPVLDTVKPDVYVKGSDYENADEDITGKINSERDTVESHGGRVVFTKDITFSSSSLINKYLDVYDPPVRDFLDKIRDSGGSERILGLVEKVKDLRILLVGDTIIDEYHYVNPLGKSAKENMIATQFEDAEVFAGGVIAAANHVANFCGNIEVITSLGETDSYEWAVRGALKPNVTLNAVTTMGRPTTRKRRYVESGYMRKLFEVYFMDDSPIAGAEVEDLNSRIAAAARNADVVIVTDFGHGLIGPSTIDVLIQNSKFLAVNVQTNSGNQGFNLITKYPGMDFLCVDAPEARLAIADKYSDITHVLGEALPARVDCGHIIITHGSRGCYAYAPEEGIARVPAFTKTVIDTVGAGDAFFAVTAPMVAAGASMEDAAFIGNAAGAMKVGIVGHRSSVEKVPLIKFLTTLLK